MRLTNLWSGILAKGTENDAVPTQDADSVDFTLMYGELVVATISHRHGEWTLRYSEEFKTQSEIPPLSDFPNVERVYTSDSPWPLLMSRIPSARRYDIMQILSREHIDPSDTVRLLQRFGQHAVSSPFDLVHE